MFLQINFHNTKNKTKQKINDKALLDLFVEKYINYDDNNNLFIVEMNKEKLPDFLDLWKKSDNSSMILQEVEICDCICHNKGSSVLHFKECCTNRVSSFAEWRIECI